MIESEIKWMESQDIIPRGFVSDAELEDIIAHVKVFVVPILKSTGVHMKLLRTLQYGIPTVMTSASTHGLDFPTGNIDAPAAVVAPEEPTLFADAIVALLNNETLWQSARDQILQHAERLRELDHAASDVQDFLTQLSSMSSRYAAYTRKSKASGQTLSCPVQLSLDPWHRFACGGDTSNLEWYKAGGMGPRLVQDAKRFRRGSRGGRGIRGVSRLDAGFRGDYTVWEHDRLWTASSRRVRYQHVTVVRVGILGGLGKRPAPPQSPYERTRSAGHSHTVNRNEHEARPMPVRACKSRTECPPRNRWKFPFPCSLPWLVDNDMRSRVILSR
eukprot:scaffold6638_cov374-Prasinococcus_capsulatus_cf.AAC.6